MPRFCLLVADAARARLYFVEPSAADGSGRAVTLHERADYIRPERRHPAGESLSEHPGTGHTSSGLGFGLDDHRADRTREIDRRFAVELAASLAQLIAETRTGRAVIVASPRMLGELRGALPQVLAADIRLDEVALDLTRLTTPQLHDHLAGMGLVPARERRARA